MVGRPKAGSDPQFVYITKHVLTKGILKCRVVSMTPNSVTVEWPWHPTKLGFFYGSQWQRTRDEAIRISTQKINHTIRRFRLRANRLAKMEIKVKQV